MRKLPLFAIALLISGCGLTREPPRTEVSQPPPAVPVSYATLGAKISLPGLQRYLESKLPAEYNDHHDQTEWAIFNPCWPWGKCEVKTKVCDWEWAVRVTRTPFVVRPIAGGLSVTSTYRLWGRVNAHGPVCPPFQETTEPDGELTLTLTARPSFNDLYALQPNVGYDAWHWDVRPGIKIAGIFKVTFGTKAGEAIDRMLNDARDKLNADLAARLDFRSNVESGWRQLHDPIPLADDGTSWLRLKPLGLNATPMISDAEFARIYLSLKSQNEAVFGSRPAGYEPVDLTILRHDAVDESFLLSAVGGVEYAALEARARKEWAGRTISMDWGRLKLNDFRVYQSDDRLVIGVSVKAMPHKLPYVEGWLYLVGKPVVKDGRLFFENLDYRANTNNPLVQLAAYLFRDSAKRELERKLSFDLSAPLDQIRNTLNSAKPRPIGNLGEVRLRVDNISVLPPVADAKALRIPVVAKGKLEAVFLPYGSDAGSAP